MKKSVMAPASIHKLESGCNDRKAPRRRSCRQCQIFKGMNGSMPRTRRSRNSTDSPLSKPMVSDQGFEIRDAVFGEMTCTAPACGYQCYSKKTMLTHIAEKHGGTEKADEKKDNDDGVSDRVDALVIAVGGSNDDDAGVSDVGGSSDVGGGAVAAILSLPPTEAECLDRMVKITEEVKKCNILMEAECNSQSPSSPPHLDMRVPDVSLDTSIDTDAETEVEEADEEPNFRFKPTFRFGVRSKVANEAAAASDTNLREE